MMNGQTGKVIGEIPIDKSKVFVYILKNGAIGLLLISTILFLITRKIKVLLFLIVLYTISLFLSSFIIEVALINKMKLKTNSKNMNNYYTFKEIKYNSYDEYEKIYNDDLYKQDILVSNNQDINYHNVIDNYYNLIKK